MRTDEVNATPLELQISLVDAKNCENHLTVYMLPDGTIVANAIGETVGAEYTPGDRKSLPDCVLNELWKVYQSLMAVEAKLVDALRKDHRE